MKVETRMKINAYCLLICLACIGFNVFLYLVHSPKFFMPVIVLGVIGVIGSGTSFVIGAIYKR